MKDSMHENEVYFLGQDRPTPKKWKDSFTGWKAVIAILAVIALSAAVSLTLGFHKEGHADTIEGEKLDTVSILPQGSKMPRFNETEDISAFLHWVSRNLVYPEGMEKGEELVVVSFIVRTDGKIGGIDIQKAPRNKAFGNAVIDLLKQSPDWKPAELANGKKVNMKLILPVLFRNE